VHLRRLGEDTVQVEETSADAIRETKHTTSVEEAAAAAVATGAATPGGWLDRLEAVP